jgi:transcriptional regulator with XRE-family HTH domain
LGCWFRSWAQVQRYAEELFATCADRPGGGMSAYADTHGLTVYADIGMISAYADIVRVSTYADRGGGVRITSLNDLRNLVRARRTALHLTQAAAAARAGVTRQWVSGFENGQGGDLTLVLRLLAALDLDVMIAPPGSTGIRDTVTASVTPAARRVIDLDAHLAQLTGETLAPPAAGDQS